MLDQLLVHHFDLVLTSNIEVLVVRQDNVQISSCLMLLLASQVRELEVPLEQFLVLSSKAASDEKHLSLLSEKVARIFLEEKSS